MCGICGFFVRSDRLTVDTKVLQNMCAALVHRGPDDVGVYAAERIALGMRRLSIIDLKTGRQPIHNEDRSVWTVFNGEIYNFHELRDLLEKKGHVFYTKSDTEVIVHAYEEYGEHFVHHLRGMFAIALWDGNRNRLILARDRLGIKPLYYADLPGLLVFASEIKSLRCHPSISTEIDPQACDAYLTLGYVPDPMSIYKAVKKLPPGHLIVCDPCETRVLKYWDLNFTPDLTRTPEQWQEAIEETLLESVRMRLISDVPLGAFLSGGIDSSTVVALMAKCMDAPVKTFSIGFEDEQHNELQDARRIARHFRTDHHEFVVKPNVQDLIEMLVHQFDEPFADSSAIPTYLVSKMARDYVTVVLSGDGGDELFAGYNRYVREKIYQRWGIVPRTFGPGAVTRISRKLPQGLKGRRLLNHLALSPEQRYLDEVSIFATPDRYQLYIDGWQDLLHNGQAERIMNNYFGQARDWDFISKRLYVDTKSYLPGDILTKVDRTSMAVSLEVRVPLLDHKLVELVSRIPSNLKLNGTERKRIFRKVAAKLLPQQTLQKKKHGFSVPVARWFTEAWRNYSLDVLTDPATRRRGFFDQAYIEREVIGEHFNGRRDQSPKLWALMIFELWQRQNSN